MSIENIKRFGFGKHEMPLDNGAKLMVPAITEQQDGEYVLYADYQKLESQMEAVGAGGVSSQRITKRPYADHIPDVGNTIEPPQ